MHRDDTRTALIYLVAGAIIIACMFFVTFDVAASFQEWARWDD